MIFKIFCRGGFSVDQVARLKEQVAQSFQLCTQMSILQNLLREEPDPFWEAQMVQSLLFFCLNFLALLW